MAGQEFDLNVRLRGENNLSKPIEDAGRSLEGLKEKASGLGGQLAALGATLGIGLGFSSLIKSSFEFQSEVEDTAIAIAGMVQTFNRVNGEVPSYTRALEEAETAHEGLRAAALSTAFELRDLAGAFQTIYGQATSAGLSTTQTVKFTETLAHLAKSQMKTLDEVAHQMSLVLGGTVRAEGSIGVLMKSMGISSETIASWKAGGEVFDQFTKKFQPMVDLAPRVAQTWSAAASNLKDAFKQMLGEGMGSAFEAAKKAVLDFTASMVTVSPEGFVFNEEILSRVREFSEAIAEVIPHVFRFGGAVFDLLSKIGPILKDLAPVFNALLDVITATTHGVSELTDGFGTLAVTAYAAVKAMGLFGIHLPSLMKFLPTLAGMNTYLTGLLTTAGSLAGSFVFFGTVTAALVVAAGAVYALKLAFVDLREENEKLTASVGGMKQTTLLSLDNLVTKYPAASEEAAKLSEQIRKTAVGDTEALNKLNAEVIALQRHFKEAGAAAAERPKLEKAPIAIDEENLFKLEASTAKAQSDALAAVYTGFYQKVLQENATYAATKKQQARDLFLLNAKSREEQAEQQKLIEETEKAHYAKLAAIERERVLDATKNRNAVADAWATARSDGLEGAEKEAFELAEGRKKIQREYDLAVEAARSEGTNKAKAIEQAEELKAAAILGITNKETLLWKNYAKASADVLAGAEIELARLAGDEFGARRLEAEKKLNDALYTLGQRRKTMSVQQARDEEAALLEVFQGTTGQIKADAEIQAAAISGSWSRLWAAVGNTTKAGIAALRANMKTAENELLAWGTTAGQGFQAGILRVVGSLKTLTETTADLTAGLFEGLGKSLEEGFFAVVTGRVKDLGEIFKNFGLNLVKMLTQAFGQIATSWLLTGQLFASNPLKASMTEGEGGGGLGGILDLLKGGRGSGGGLKALPGGRSYTGYQDQMYSNQATAPGGGGLGGLAGMAGLGIAGFGLAGLLGGGTTGQKVGGGLMMAGGLAGAAMGGVFGSAAAALVVPVVGWAIAAVLAIVGLVVTLFSKPPTIKIPVKVGEEIQRDATSVISQALLTSYGKAVGGLAAIAKAGGGNIAGITEILRGGEIPDEYFKSQQMTVFGKNQADYDKGYKYLLEEALPRTMMSWAFGRQQTGTTGKEGNETQLYGVPTFGAIDFSKDGTAIVKMLQGLEFSNEKIQGIASQIDLRTPEDFVKWLSAWVGAAKGAKDLVEKMKRPAADVLADLEKESKEPAAVGFRTAMDALADEAAAAMTLTADAQVGELDRITKAAADRYQEELQFIDQIRQTIKALHEQSQALKTTIDEGLMTPEALRATREATVAGAVAQIGAATSPEEVTAAFAAAHDALRQLIDGLMQQVERARALKASGESLQELWGKPRFEEPLGVAEKAAKDYADLQALYADAQKHTGQEQLDDIARIQEAVRQRYEEEVQLIATIRANMADLAKSIESQKFEIGFGMGTDEEKKAMIEGRLGELSAGIAGAKTPEELKALTDEYQSLISRYIGQFGEDSPNRDEAKAKSLALLDQLKADADARYKALEEEAQKNHEATKKVLDDSQALLVENEAAAAAALAGFKSTIDEIDEAARTKLLSIVDDVVEANTKLIAALDALRVAVTGGATPPAEPPTEPGPDTEERPGPKKPPPADANAPVSLELSVNVKSGSPEEIADQVAKNVIEPMRQQIVDLLRRNNLELVKRLQEKGALLAWSG